MSHQLFEFRRSWPRVAVKKTGDPNLKIQGPIFLISGVLALGGKGGGLEPPRARRGWG